MTAIRTAKIPAPTRAGIYVRLSMDRDGAGLGVARQERECRDLATALGWEIVEVYTDNDTSATSGKPRPGYARMLADADAGRIDAIIAWHPDRLYRRVTDLGDLVDACKRNGTQIATARAGHIDLATATGRLVAGLLAQVASYEVEHKTERWRSSFRQAREAGRFVTFGQRTFGYTQDGEVIETEAVVARRIAREVIAGRSLTRICDELDREGVTTSAGNPWRPATLRRYLSNPRIAGLMTAYGEVVGDGDWTPILDRETWDTAVAILDAAPRKGRAPRVAVLGGLIYCGTCGTRLMTTGHKSGRRYACPSPNRPGQRGCGGPSVNAELVEQFVEAWARERLDTVDVRARVAELRETEGLADLATEVAAYEDRLVELDAELAKPDVPVARITRAIDAVNDRLVDARARLAQASAGSAVERDDTGSLVWPDDLARRRQAIEVALDGRRIHLDPARRRGRGFDPDRVRFD